MSEKFCIFCGEKPKDKNLEHVIPQWLIRMTGREKPDTGDIFSLYPDAEKHIPFMRFAFPACTECNSKYAKMEAAVKPVLERILSGQSISGLNASLLMDWFDKVRIGLWLSNMYYDTKLKGIHVPNLVSDVLQFQNVIQSKNIISSPDVILGTKINNMMLESMKKQKSI